MLEVPIPNLQFSNIVIDENQSTIDIPFIADYIAAVYKYAIGVAAVLATVMIMIGGLQYLMAGGDTARVGSAKKRMTDAVIGLLLTLGTYMILTAINPDLVKLQNIRVALVEQKLFEFESVMATTEINTSKGTGGSSTGSYNSQFADCPIELSEAAAFKRPDRETRTTEFYDKIGSAITGASVTERIMAIADAASKCGVHFGACGRTAGTINVLAGVGGSECLSASKGCWNWGKQQHAVSKEQIKYFETVRCTKHNEGSSDCVSSNREATAKVYEKLKGEMDAGWPDTWANELEAGDTIIVYNGNSSRFGTHAAIFVGWASGGKAQIIQGAYKKTVWEGTICIKSECSRPVPLIKTYKPQ